MSAPDGCCGVADRRCDHPDCPSGTHRRDTGGSRSAARHAACSVEGCVRTRRSIPRKSGDYHRADRRAIVIGMLGFARDEQDISDGRELRLLEAARQIRWGAPTRPSYRGSTASRSVWASRAATRFLRVVRFIVSSCGRGELTVDRSHSMIFSVSCPRPGSARPGCRRGPRGGRVRRSCAGRSRSR